ncbi:MAG: hypothetical protein H6666_16450 [Ardenticatenaceae bacterium]|nr:hypothetical protein [Anaerolineales bacterium]MCB8919507.1 hypothetical protein [Ardenticatenaceae bacterium]
MPQQQNPRSSTWWFFLLFPKQGAGYGPRQMMFTLAASVGSQVNIAGISHQGMDLRRPLANGLDRFNTVAVGWIHDGVQLHEDVVHQLAPATLSTEGYLTAWADAPGREPHGAEIRVAADDPLALEAHFRGERGEARFRTWGDLDSRVTAPHEAINIHTPLGGTHFVAWRYVHFAGEFTSPAGTETLTGIGYFQRVCLNVPAFPWKWVWALLPDGTLFSAYVPYAGLQALRRKHAFYRSGLEKATLPVLPGAFLYRPGWDDWLRVDRVAVRPDFNAGPYPHFAIRAANKAGDFIQFRAEPHAHARFFMDRQVLRGRLRTHFDYNEYLFRMVGVSGRVAGQPFDEGSAGPGYGNLEYTWGLGF